MLTLQILPERVPFALPDSTDHAINQINFVVWTKLTFQGSHHRLFVRKLDQIILFSSRFWADFALHQLIDVKPGSAKRTHTLRRHVRVHGSVETVGMM